MKKRIQWLLLWVALQTVFLEKVEATIFRLGFPGAAVAGKDFTYDDFNNLQSAANNNDTVQLYQQYFPANTPVVINLTKPLHFIGYGYFLNKNTGLQVVNIPDSSVNSPIYLDVANGCDGSTFQGLSFYQITLATVSNITIKRCKVTSNIALNNASAVSNITINGCFSSHPSTFSNNGFHVVSGNYGPITNLKIINNLLGGIYLGGGTTGTIANNVMIPNVQGYPAVNCNWNAGTTSNVLIKNNIVTDATYPGCYFETAGNIGLIKNNVFAYPATNCTAVNGNGNLYNVSMATTFTNWNGGTIYSDAQLALATGASALTAGRTNANAVTPCGLFGGETAELYKLSGIPAVPSFYANTLPYIVSNAVTNYSGTVSTRSNTANNITLIEFYVDTDPGIGLATSAGTFTASAQVVGKSVTTNISALTPGMHALVIRSKDAAGIWSLNNIRYFIKQYPTPAAVTLSNVSRVEYFIDTDPGYGLATNYPITASTNINAVIAYNPTALSEGIHNLGIRAKAANGSWSLTNRMIFFKPYDFTSGSTTLPAISRIEYFIDTDPGYGNALSVSFPAGTDVNNVVIPLDPSTVSEGVHRFTVRVKDANGQWSLLNSFLFYKPYNISSSTNTLPALSRIEYFIDTDPGYGNASVVSFPAGSDVSNVVIPLDPSTVSEGIHRFTARVMDANGQWSLLNSFLFYKPYQASNTSTTLPALSRLEYFIDVDPGLGQATAVSITPGIDLNNLVIPVDLTNLINGSHRAVFRAQDANGQWSLLNHWEFIGGEMNGVMKPGSGEALTLDGVDDQIHVGNWMTEQNFTIDLWVNPAATQVSYADIFDNNHSTTQGFVCQNNPSNNAEYSFSTCNASGPTTLSFTLVPNVWQHLTCVKSSSDIRVYVNGILINSTSWSGLIDYVSPQLSFGNWANLNRNWNGQIDEIRIFNTALSETEIRERMCRKMTVTDPLYGALIAYYNLDEGVGSTAHNLVDNTHHASIANAASWVRSAAPIGDISTYTYGGTNLHTTLSIPTRNDSMQAFVLSGNPDGLHEYAVLETPNTTNGIQGVGSNNRYFGTFVVNGTNPLLQLNHYVDGIAGTEYCNINYLSTYHRAHNAETSWNNTSSNVSITPGNNFVQYDAGYPGEYMLGSTGAPLQTDSAMAFCKDTLDLKFYLQGYYTGSGQMNSVLMNEGVGSDPNICDSVWIDVYNNDVQWVESAQTLVDIDGNARAYFYLPKRNEDYYIGVRHRNTVETYSANMVNFQTLCTYDFTGDATMAFGDAQAEVEPGIFALYTGDVNQDWAVDGFDYLEMDPQIVNGDCGYFATDVNGDGCVDAFDFLVLSPNIDMGITVQTP